MWTIAPSRVLRALRRIRRQQHRRLRFSESTNLMTPTTRKRDIFPMTQRTWIGRQLASGSAGLDLATRRVMEIYAKPLKIYCLGSSYRRLGDAEEIVAGFFADRLSRPQFLRRWMESGRPLRFWLIVGFKHYCLELAKARKRGHVAHELYDASVTNTNTPDDVFHRESALSMIREALRSAELDCRANGLEEHWRIFLRHHLDGRDYGAISEEFGVDRRRAAVMARTAANKFKGALRDLIAWEGAAPAEIDLEIRSLMEAASL